MTPDTFREIAPTLPGQPGIYKYYDAGKKLIYVGKAKNLRKRISSYFTKTLQSYKTLELVRRIQSIEYTIVASEQDAFLLENSLIKQFTRLFEIEGIELKFEPAVLDFMVEKALEYKLGARGLRSICEGILTDAMYELPSQKVKHFDVTLEYATRKFNTTKLSLLKVA